MSHEQENSIVWSDESDIEVTDLDDEQSDRLFSFEVSKTNEQEEGVTVRPGFSVCHSGLPDIIYLSCPPDCLSGDCCSFNALRIRASLWSTPSKTAQRRISTSILEYFVLSRIGSDTHHYGRVLQSNPAA